MTKPTNVSHNTRAHAKFAPSAMERTVNCPGWLKLAEGRPEKGATVFTNHGTAAHELCEICLGSGREPAEFEGQVIDLRLEGDARISEENEADGFNAFEVDAEMIDAVQMYLDEIAARDLEDCIVWIEEKLDMTHLDPDCSGTSDALIYNPKTRRLTVGDFKYGQGLAVDAEHNHQLRTYAAGAIRRLHNYAIDEVELLIVQPRAYHRDGPVRSQVLSIVDVRMFEEDIRDAIMAARAENPPLIAGHHCEHFCPNIDTCPAFRQHLTENSGINFGMVEEEPIELPAIEAMDSKRLGMALVNAPRIEKWIKAIKELGKAEAERGNVPEGMKLVHSKQYRKFNKMLDVAEELKKRGCEPDDFQVVKVVSPAQFEKNVGKLRAALLMEGLLDETPPGTTLAPLTDKRPAVTPKGGAFGVVED